VQAVEPDDRQPVTIDAQQLDHTHSDGVGARRRAQGKGAALNAVIARYLQHQISRGPVHPVEKDKMAAGLDILETFAPVRVEVGHANRFRFARVLRAVLAFLPGRANAADEIEAGVRLSGKRDGLFALPDTEVLARHLPSFRACLFSTSANAARLDLVNQAAKTQLDGLA